MTSVATSETTEAIYAQCYKVHHDHVHPACCDVFYDDGSICNAMMRTYSSPPSSKDEMDDTACTDSNLSTARRTVDRGSCCLSASSVEALDQSSTCEETATATLVEVFIPEEYESW